MSKGFISNKSMSSFIPGRCEQHMSLGLASSEDLVQKSFPSFPRTAEIWSKCPCPKLQHSGKWKA